MNEAIRPHEVDTSTPEGKTWLRHTIFDYVRAHPWAPEDAISRHVEGALDATGEDYMLGGGDIEGLLYDLVVKERALDWRSAPDNEDAPLLYDLTNRIRLGC